jgi:3-oxosteroid 1-dehydrogenase
MIFVDANGRRVVNEKSMYQERTPIHFVRDEGGGFPNRLIFMIFDESVLSDPRPWSNPWPAGAAEESYIIKGNDFRQLAEAIEQRLTALRDSTGGFELDDGFADQLVSTVERFDDFARRGVDEDFHRGETDHELDWNRAARDGNLANPTMYPFAEEGPYYAVIICGGTLDTKGGPRINQKSQVLDRSGNPIPRLYGAGNCIASPTGQAYWSGGSTIGPALAFAYIAAKTVSAEVPRTELLRSVQ